jgi:hypothetical protein
MTFSVVPSLSILWIASLPLTMTLSIIPSLSVIWIASLRSQGRHASSLHEATSKRRHFAFCFGTKRIARTARTVIVTTAKQSSRPESKRKLKHGDTKATERELRSSKQRISVRSVAPCFNHHLTTLPCLPYPDLRNRL